MEAILNAAFKAISLLEIFALLFTQQKKNKSNSILICTMAGPCKFTQVGHDSHLQCTYM